jgi:hypothetical protein
MGLAAELRLRLSCEAVGSGLGLTRAVSSLGPKPDPTLRSVPYRPSPLRYPGSLARDPCWPAAGSILPIPSLHPDFHIYGPPYLGSAPDNQRTSYPTVHSIDTHN